jgi:hypothetical protein
MKIIHKISRRVDGVNATAVITYYLLGFIPVYQYIKEIKHV